MYFGNSYGNGYVEYCGYDSRYNFWSSWNKISI